MELNVINSASPYYEKVLSLRNKILRIPLGLNLADEDLSDEENQVTIIMTRDEQVVACVMLKIIDKDIIKLRQMAVDDAVQGIGVGATMLARRWQSAQLVRIYNDTIARLLNNPDIIAALENIEAFRNLGKDLTRVINTELALAKVDRNKKDKTPSQKQTEKENKSFKRELRDKLLKFVSRVPVFMYLTDYREETLKDVITQLERPLFTRVTGLKIQDFEKMCEIGVFNSQAMNSAIFSFRRFELGSLHYAGGGTELETIGLFDTTVSAIEGL